MNKKDAFKAVVEETLRTLVKEGIDKKLVEASINIKEFQLREAEFRGYPKGLIYNIKCLDSWLYGEEPFIHLEYEEALKNIKSALTTNYFEKLIEKFLLGSNHSSLLILKPKKGLSEERESKLKQKLADYKSSLSEKELARIIEESEKLKERQNSPDSPEALESIPLLKLSDINPKSEKLTLEVKEEKGLKVLAHPIFTNNIGYVQLFFDTTAVKQEQVQYIALLADILGKISTDKYHYSELSKEINIHTGDIRFIVQVYGDKNDYKKYSPKLTVKAKALMDKLPRMFELVEEITSHTRLDEKKRLREIVREVKSRIEMRLVNEGHMTSAKRLLSYLTDQSRYIELLTGIEYFKFLSEIDKQFDAKSDEVLKNLQEVYTAVFNRNNLICGITCDEKDYPRFLQSFEKYAEGLPASSLKHNTYTFELSKQNEGLLTQSNVQYVAKGYNFVELGYKYTGTLQVLKSIARYDYLWNNIRVKGGAYGAMAGFERSGNLFFVSYRDPNLKETIKVYDEFEKYLKAFDVDSREMTKYIIGTMSGVDTPLTPSMKGERAAEYYIRNISYEDIQREREEILKASKEEIKALAELVGDAMKQNRYCALGNEAKIKQSKELFDSMIYVLD